jgi:hypothetical protein
VSAAWKVGQVLGCVVLVQTHRNEAGATVLGGRAIASDGSGDAISDRSWDNLRIDHATGEARIL